MTMINTDGLFVGGTAWADFGTYHRPNVMEGKITHRTDGGRITVAFSRLTVKFNKRGKEIGYTGHFHAPHLITLDDYKRLTVKQAEARRINSAIQAVRHVDTIPVNVANKDQILDALRKAIEAVEAI